ncbi:ABC transporter ATP-binding protein [Phragmitibacter flavus]|uniref:ABC transporter ATP-binding protein n=1 Tax=Phragmitibacter flavus TaxID=2576071 RepID=A0A5R8KKM0_9BACT|nr:ABC transporter ATP-binding protein [Phragmitibacter flavus]TLD72790.1 ABC transporter ATP-binding protein [Phragmitibacter flavus]
MSFLIELADLHKRFRKTEAVSGLSLQVPEGQVTALLGPNGAGKTTTLKCLLNLHRPDSGSATVLGCDSKKLGPAQFTQLGYVSESMELPLWMTVDQFLAYCRPLYPQWDREFEAKLLTQFDLPLRTKLRDLSRGMRMKAALLSSLAYRPKLVILDEPFSGLDPLVRDEFIRGLLELTEQEGWTVLISSHDIEEVQRLADRIAIINRGKLALDETNDSLQSRFRAVEIHLTDTTKPPAQLPTTWLHPEQAARTLRFVESQFIDEPTLARQIQSHLSTALTHQTTPMTLREIFIALARAYRLQDTR